MIEQATRFETTNNKKPLRIKSMFRETCSKKSVNRLEISSPILQHSTNIFSLVSPTHTHHPLASPQPVPNVIKNVRYTLASDPREFSQKNSNSNKNSRRHSYSSTPLYNNLPPLPSTNKPILRETTERRRSSVKIQTSSAAASIAPTTSRSTPLKKVKTYNIQKRVTPEEQEKIRKMQELEDLISGRRGSTLKLTLTPKGLK